MQARATLRGSVVSKKMIAIVASVLAAVTMLVIGGYVVRALSLPATAPAVHFVAGQPGPSNYFPRRGGTQSMQDAAPAGSSGAPAFHAPGSRRGGSQY